jgi:hypothetical protein
MIRLLSNPNLEFGQYGWTLTLLACDAFDENYSFRELFGKMTEALARHRDVTLTLPPEAPFEDFVEGTLRWGPTVYDVYFERSLGYVDLSSTSESCTRELLDALAPHFVWPQAAEG